MKIRMIALAALFAAALALSLGQVTFAKGTKTIIALTASAQFPNAKGKAVYKVDGSEREFQVEVENVKKLAGTRLGLFVNGTKIGGMLVNSLGEARFNRNTDLGQAVPLIKAGTTVQVRTAGGVLIASGKF
jgi:hypothetical protein